LTDEPSALIIVWPVPALAKTAARRIISPQGIAETVPVSAIVVVIVSI